MKLEREFLALVLKYKNFFCDNGVVEFWVLGTILGPFEIRFGGYNHQTRYFLDV